MLLDNYKKESPIIGVAGMGGGINSYIFLSSGGGGDYVISKSLRFNSADTAYLSTTTPNITTFTYSAWIKRCGESRDDILVSGSSTGFYLYFHTDGTIKINTNSANVFTSNGQYRDPSAWYNICFSNDGSTFKLYVNGVLDKSVSLATQFYSGVLTIAKGSTNYADYYLADVHLVDGQALLPTSFGSFDSDVVWQPGTYSGTYGTNGSHLDFKNTDAIGNDAAGSNNWTANNITTAVYGLATANQGFDAVTYTGTGSAQAIGGLAFQPDFVWLKRMNQSGNHCLSDSVRGFGASGSSKLIYSDATNSEDTGNTQIITAFNSDGFTLGTNGIINGSGSTHVAWCWKAGGAASSNSNGTITSSVSASTTYGFSVVTWTGAGTGSAKTVGHSLGAVPKFIISKSRSLSDNWGCYHVSLGNTKDIFLNTTGIPRSYPTWNNTDPTSSVFSVGQTGQVNEANATYVAYCWSEISGYSKFGSYTGNGNATGTIVTTGFKPRFLVVKRTDAVDNWTVFDSARNLNNDLKWNTNELEGSAPVAFLSDGFQLKNTYGSTNANNGTYIYAAFASKPDQSAIDVFIDSPAQSVADETDTGVGGQITGNYATLNPLSKSSQTNIVIANGNLEASNTSSSGQGRVNGTIAMSSGKLYFEATVTGSSNFHEIGIIKTTEALTHGIGYFAGGYSYAQAGSKFNNNSTPSYGASYTTGDTIGVAFDADNGTLAFYKNGASQGTAFSGLSGTYYPAVSTYSSGANFGWKANFGQRAFAHTAPSGYKCLTVENLSDPTGAAAEPNKYFDVRSNLGAQFTINDLKFSTDLSVSKSTSNDEYWIWTDVVRGFDKNLKSNTTDAQGSGTVITNVSDTGFQSTNNYFSTGRTYATWNWDAGTSTVTNNNGSIASQVRASTASGFSIVKWTGNRSAATVGHGLNSAVKFYFVKNLDQGSDWLTWHTGLSGGGQGFIRLNTSGAASTASSPWNSTIPTNSVFSLGADSESNGNGDEMIAYCWSEVAGYSKIGSFSGNGTTDNVFVYTGFQPKFVLTKYASSGGDWMILDTSRRPNGSTGGTIVPNVDKAQDNYYSNTQVGFDFLSNGFKIRHNGSPMGDSGRTVIYYAVAEHPFKTARAY